MSALHWSETNWRREGDAGGLHVLASSGEIFDAQKAWLELLGEGPTSEPETAVQAQPPLFSLAKEIGKAALPIGLMDTLHQAHSSGSPPAA